MKSPSAIRSVYRSFRGGAVVLLLALNASLFADTRPNILMVLTDDHSVPHVGCYGNQDVSPEKVRPSIHALRWCARNG